MKNREKGKNDHEQVNSLMGHEEWEKGELHFGEGGDGEEVG